MPQPELPTALARRNLRKPLFRARQSGPGICWTVPNTLPARPSPSGCSSSAAVSTGQTLELDYRMFARSEGSVGFLYGIAALAAFGAAGSIRRRRQGAAGAAAGARR